jgi:hypothetical protein
MLRIEGIETLSDIAVDGALFDFQRKEVSPAGGNQGAEDKQLTQLKSQPYPSHDRSPGGNRALRQG